MTVPVFAHVGSGPSPLVPRLSLNLAHVLGVAWYADDARVSVDYQSAPIPLTFAEAEALVEQLLDAADAGEPRYTLAEEAVGCLCEKTARHVVKAPCAAR